VTNLESILEDILSRRVPAGSTLTIAGTKGRVAEPVARWSPASAAEEPRFLIYSVTKTFVAALFLLLQESGELSLDDPVNGWLPEVPRAERITLRRLLAHSAGIPDYGGLAAYHAAIRETPGRAWRFERYAAETYAHGLLFEPGKGWAYSNPGYMLLRRIAERVTGLPYARTIDERIVKPLGLGSMTLAEVPADLADLAPATSAALSTDGSPRDVRQHYDPGWVSHGVLASTASDLARFISALFDGRLLSPASIAEMTSLTRVPVPGSQTDPRVRPYQWREPSYGLGLMVDPAAPWGAIYGHNGAGPGYSASVFHAPELGGVTVAVLGSEAEGFSAEQVVFEVLDALRDDDQRIEVAVRARGTALE
jgi:D-alanyl-D-alanine carboxypeptidase